MTARMKPARYEICDILILTGSIGAGHISAARAVAEAIAKVSRGAVRVEIVDLLTALANFVTFATKTVYLGSLKLSPKIYELLFSQSDSHEWPLKILNALSAPFMQKKFLAMLKKTQPRMLVSTYPVWDLLAKKAWKKYNSGHAPGGKLPFVSIITDSVGVHQSWTYGHPDYFLVANEDTAVALENLGIAKRRIRCFGYPISRRFEKPASRADFQQRWNLSPKRTTLLLIVSTGTAWSRIKELAAAIRRSRLKKMQLVIIACGSPGWEKHLKKMRWPWPTRITGWTNAMPAFIHGADIVLTKAGGATVMECIASKKPMIIFDAIPGHEIGNAVLVQKYNLGVVLNRSLENFDQVVEHLMNHEALIKKNLARQQKPGAAETIARFLLEL